MSRHVAFISDRCPNCQRFVDATRASPSATKNVQLVNVDSLPPSQRASLQVVPTVQTHAGQVLAGTKAFEFLKQFEADTEFEAFDGLGCGGLEFSSCLEGEGASKFQKMDMYGAFEPLP